MQGSIDGAGVETSQSDRLLMCAQRLQLHKFVVISSLGKELVVGSRLADTSLFDEIAMGQVSLE